MKTINVSYDDYIKDPHRYDGFKEMGYYICTVDGVGSYIPLDKNGADNLKKTEDNIQERFELEDPNQADEDDDNY